MSNVKILYITNDPSPFQIEFVAAIKDRLSANYEIIIAFKERLRPYRAHWNDTGIPEDSIIPHSQGNLYAYLDGIDPDVLVFREYRTRLAYYIRKYAILRKKQLIVGPSEKLTEYKTSCLSLYIRYRIYGYFAKKCAGVIAVGNNAQRLYQKVTKVPVVNIPYCFNMDHLLNRPRSFSETEITFLISGRLEPFRDPIYSILLFSEICKSTNLKLKLIISGKGTLFPDCVKQIAALNIESIVEWRNEFNDWKEIHELYFCADVLLCLQEYSGWGLIVQEAMAAGMLVISTYEVEAADQLVIDGFNGILVNKCNKNLVKNIVVKAIENVDRMSKLSENARKSVVSTDVRVMADSFINFIEELNVA